MSALPERFAEYIATLRDAGEQPSMSRYPGLPSQPWYDAAAIPAAVALERAAPQIIAEFGQLDPSAFVPEAEPIARSGSWDVFLLYERGRRHDERCNDWSIDQLTVYGRHNHRRFDERCNHRAGHHRSVD